MDIKHIIEKSVQPPIYEKGSSFMWTDEHISKQLLQVHLNPDIDLGSRKRSTIVKTANWILETHPSKDKLNILDLGCGPGLYSEIFAQNGHSVTGMDISGTSIAYARQSATDKGLDIAYLQASYLDVDLGTDRYDLIVLIYADLGVLPPTERNRLLGNICKALKKGGLFIFDVMRDNKLEDKTTPRTWEAPASGFWKDAPYLALSESFLYKDEKVILFQHIVVDSDENMETYRFWTHFFSEADVEHMLKPHGFAHIRFRNDVLPAGDQWNGDNVLFCVAEK